MSNYKSRQIIIVLGRTGQGKSIWSRYFMRLQKRVFAFDPLQDFNVNYVSLDELVKLNKKQKFVEGEKFRVGISSHEDIELLGSQALINGNDWLVIEEAGTVFEKGAKAPDWLREASFIGRHQQLNILIAAQRPVSIPIDLRSQAHRVVCFHQREKADMTWLDQYYGDRTKEILDLDELECLDSETKSITRYKIDWRNDDKHPEAD